MFNETHRRKVQQNAKATAALITRLAVGAVFVQSGFAKITHHAMTIAFFANLGFGSITPIVSAIIPWIEFVCGVALIGGIASRFAAFLLTADMAVAILVANPDVTTDIFKLLRFYDFLYILLLIWLISFGPGPYSLGRLVFIP